jgi:flagellar biosynthesis protein FliQ
MDTIIKFLNDGMLLVLFLSLPAVLLAASVGLVVGILQAVTQVQEQTIPAAPKIALVFLLIIFGGPLMLQMMQEYTRESIIVSMEILPHQEKTVLPPTSPFATDRLKGKAKDDFFKTDDGPKSPSKIGTMVNQQPTMPPSSNQPVKKQPSGVVPRQNATDKYYLQKSPAGPANPSNPSP